MAFKTTLRVIPLPVSAHEVGRLFRAYGGEFPDSVTRDIAACSELLVFSGPLYPSRWVCCKA